MLKRVLNYFQFLFKSTNQHGVHSPFVYSYLTEGIYDSKKHYKSYKKKYRLLQATIEYFQVQETFGKPGFSTYPSTENTKNMGQETYPKLHYIKAIESYTSDDLNRLIKSVDRSTILYIDSPHKSAKAHEKDRKSTRLNSSHVRISYAVFCL